VAHGSTSDRENVLDILPPLAIEMLSSHNSAEPDTDGLDFLTHYLNMRIINFSIDILNILGTEESIEEPVSKFCSRSAPQSLLYKLANER
jgi:hypothetical protein